MSAAPPEALQIRALEVALEEAREAARHEEVPVGAALFDAGGRLLARDHNQMVGRADPTAHAERLVLSAAGQLLGVPRMPPGSLLAVTLEPCAMCAGALVLARVDWLLFGALDPKTGACGSLRDIVRDPRLNHRVEVLPARRADTCGQLLVDFFRARRSPERDC